MNKRLYMLPRMRTLPEAAKELLREDPKTCLTLPVIRRMAKEGTIPCVYSGKRALVDMSELKGYLCRLHEKEAEGKIRKVPERTER